MRAHRWFQSYCQFWCMADLNQAAFRAAGQSPGFADIAIAATAGTRNLTILTRNLRHFTPLGVAVMDPYDGLP